MTLLLKPGNPICGVSPKMMKVAAANLMKLGSAELYDLAVVLGAPKNAVKDLWDLFLENKLIEVDDDGKHYPTSVMFALATGRVGKKLPRAKAKALLDELIEKAEQSNKGSESMYLVKRIEVFGSYLDESKDQLGDLDVAWELIEKPEFDNHISWMISCNEDPESHMRRLVRPRHNAVRLISARKLYDLGFASKTVYEYKGHQVDAALEAQDQARQKARAALDSMHEMFRQAINR